MYIHIGKMEFRCTAYVFPFKIVFIVSEFNTGSFIILCCLLNFLDIPFRSTKYGSNLLRLS